MTSIPYRSSASNAGSEPISPIGAAEGVSAGSGLPLPRRRSKWVQRAVIFAGCMVLVNSLFGDRGVVGTIHARAELARASEGLAKLKRENAGLREQARRLQHDPSAIEALAREDLGLIRPGEILVVVKNPK
ncbi:MAG: septum formation initiator family protein [Acidobacteriota bacterium]